MMFVFSPGAVTLEAIKCFEEQPNGFYDMLLSVAALFHAWKNGIIGSTEIT
jgi:hypothetical protein